MLNINSEKVGKIIALANEYDAQVPSTDPDSGSNPTDDLQVDVLEILDESTFGEELEDYIDGLNEDEQVDLVALFWIGRETFEPSDLEGARETVRAEQTHSTSQYLMGAPLLGSFLQQGLDAIYAFGDVEI